MTFSVDQLKDRGRDIFSSVTNIDPNSLKVTISGVPIHEQNFYWSITSGVMPNIGSFLIDKNRNSLIEELVNPVNIEISCFGSSGDQAPREHKVKIDKLFLLQPQEIDQFQVQWNLADIRWALFQGKTAYFAYNITRRSNQRGVGVVAPRTDPAILRQPFDVFKTGRYLPNSVKTSGEPFSVLEILEREIENINTNFSDLGFTNVTDLIISPIGDKSYIQENVRSDGKSAYKAFGELLEKSRLVMGVTLDGRINIDSIDFFDEVSVNRLLDLQKRGKVAPGQIYKQDLKRVRPKSIRVRFERKIETIVKSIPEEEEAKVQFGFNDRPITPLEIETDEVVATERRKILGQVIPCINVIQVPFVPEFDDEEFDFKFGEYIPLVKYLEAIRFDRTLLKKLWWANAIEWHITGVLQEGIKNAKIEPLSFVIAQAIRDSYRQIYMIDPFYMDRIDYWEARRVAVIDEYSKFSNKSPLWQDIAIVPRVRPVDIAKNRALSPEYIKNWIVEEEDPERKNPTAGTIDLIDMELGVFKTSFPRDIDNTIALVIPSAIDNAPPAQAGGGVGIQRFLLADSDAQLRQNFTLETIISLSWMFDPVLGGGIQGGFNSDLRYHDVVFEYENAEGPSITYLSTREPARMDIDFELVNEEIINAIAESEAARIFNQYIDRTVGTIQIGDLLEFPDNIIIQGNISNVSYSISPGQPGVSGGIETHVYLRKIPMAPTIEQTLPDKAVQYVFNQLRTGSRQ